MANEANNPEIVDYAPKVHWPVSDVLLAVQRREPSDKFLICEAGVRLNPIDVSDFVFIGEA